MEDSAGIFFSVIQGKAMRGEKGSTLNNDS